MSSSTHLQVEPAYRELFRDAGLDSYPALTREKLGEPVTNEADKQVRRLTLGSGAEAQHFYLKRSTGTIPLQWMIKKWLRLTWPHSRAWDEFHAVRRLEREGFPVMKLVALGEAWRYGIPNEGLLVVAEVDGRPADDLWRSADAPLRERMMRDAGSLIGRLHQSGFYAFVRFKDMICGAVPEAPTAPIPFTLIDRECAPHRPLRRSAARSYDALAEGLFVLLAPETEPTRQALSGFARAYLAETDGYPTRDERALLAGTVDALHRLFQGDGQRARIAASGIVSETKPRT
jgi:hypothetical protein